MSQAITYFAHDKVLEETVFSLGFGMIVIDAFSKTSSIQTRGVEAKIAKATLKDSYVLEVLGKKSREYYRCAPIFLTRNNESQQYYQDLLSRDDMAIYLAYIGEKPVGFMSVRRNGKLRFIDLCDINTALIDEIGAYIEPAYRGRGIGMTLLSKCVEWCQHNEIPRIHVDFESANILARPFWLEFFTETMRSVRRTIYKDVLSTRAR